MNDYYQRNLPHYQPEYGEFFVTFCLAHSLPRSVIARLKQEKEQVLNAINADDKLSITNSHKRYFAKFDHLLARSENSKHWLKNDSVAGIVADKLHELDNKKYLLICYCIMPNHVHMLFKLLRREKPKKRSFPVTDIMKLVKGSTAFQANKILGRKGQFWQYESYDHLVRDDKERENIIRYILLNPVKAGFTQNWQDWKRSYCKKDYLPYPL